jgi:hypothetical protein
MIIENKFDIGQTVYLITDEDQHPRLITSIIVNKYDLLYQMNNGTLQSTHYDYEISAEKQLQLT